MKLITKSKAVRIRQQINICWDLHVLDSSTFKCHQLKKPLCLKQRSVRLGIQPLLEWRRKLQSCEFYHSNLYISRILPNLATNIDFKPCGFLSSNLKPLISDINHPSLINISWFTSLVYLYFLHTRITESKAFNIMMFKPVISLKWLSKSITIWGKNQVPLWIRFHVKRLTG